VLQDANDDSMRKNSVKHERFFFLSLSLRLDESDVLRTDIDCIDEYEQNLNMVIPVSSILRDVKLAKRNRSYPWADERLPVDVDRNMNDTCILEVMIQHDFMDKSNESAHHLPYDVSYDKQSCRCSISENGKIEWYPVKPCTLCFTN